MSRSSIQADLHFSLDSALEMAVETPIPRDVIFMKRTYFTRGISFLHDDVATLASIMRR